MTKAYLEDLGRMPDPGELKLWSRRLVSGVGPKAVALRIWDSREHRELVKSGKVARIGLSARTATLRSRSGGPSGATCPRRRDP